MQKSLKMFVSLEEDHEHKDLSGKKKESFELLKHQGFNVSSVKTRQQASLDGVGGSCLPSEREEVEDGEFGGSRTQAQTQTATEDFGPETFSLTLSSETFPGARRSWSPADAVPPGVLGRTRASRPDGPRTEGKRPVWGG